jgi:hypothetical protein
MTIGYPDFSRTQAAAGNNLGSYFGQKQTDPTTGVMDAIGYQYLTIQVNDTNNVNHFAMIITWYDDHGATNIVNTSQFVPVPGSNLSYQIPVVSRYVRVTASHQVALDTEVIGGIVYGSNVLTSQAITGPKSGPFIFNSQNVPATTNLFVNALYTYWGAATFVWFKDVAGAFVVQLEYFDMNTAAFVPLYKVHLNVSAIEGAMRVSLPPNPMRVGLYNLTAGAATFTGAGVLG